jgi:hypothetical protein
MGSKTPRTSFMNFVNSVHVPAGVLNRNTLTVPLVRPQIVRDRLQPFNRCEEFRVIGLFVGALLLMIGLAFIL